MKHCIKILFLLLSSCTLAARYCCQNGTAPCQTGPGPCCPRVAPPRMAYDFSKQFNEKKVWVEWRHGEPWICTQPVPLRHDLFYERDTKNIVCTRAHPVAEPQNGHKLEGARCWRSKNAGKTTIICQNDAGEITVH